MPKNYYEKWLKYKQKNPNGEYYYNYTGFETYQIWKEYNAWQKRNAADIRVIEYDGKKISQSIRDYAEFKEIYTQAKGDVARIKDEVRYVTSRSAAKAFLESYDNTEGLTIKDIRKMPTRQLASLIIGDIDSFRESKIKEFRDMGKTLTEAKRLASLAVSQYFFGS